MFRFSLILIQKKNLTVYYNRSKEILNDIDFKLRNNEKLLIYNYNNM